MASERLFPSMTSALSCLLTSERMPRVSRCVMLFKADTSGMPALSKFAYCVVNVAGFLRLGFPARSKNAHPLAQRRLRRDRRRAARRLHRHGKQSQTLDLQQRGTAIRHVQNTLNHFTGTPPCLVRKLGHTKSVTLI